jgi:hypothetical protein
MISTIAVIVLSPFGYFSRLPYCALMCCYLIERLRTAAERSEVGWSGLLGSVFIFSSDIFSQLLGAEIAE